MMILLENEFLLRALIAGIGIALIFGPFGAMVSWRRMAYFSETIAHTGLVGVALGLYFGLALSLSTLLVALIFVMIFSWLEAHTRFASDLVLGLLAPSSLALGIIILALFPNQGQVDYLALLLGDILTVSWGDIFWLYGGGAVCLLALMAIWKALFTTIVSPELAEAEGLPVRGLKLGFSVLLGLVIALSVKFVGVLLFTALLLIPALTARRFSDHPELMAGLASLLGILAVIAGLAVSYLFDLPSAAAIILMALAFFLLSLFRKRL